MTRCTLNGKLVGVRYFHETGELSDERPLKNGVLHGIQYRSDAPARLLSADLWWQDHSGFAFLSEARYVKEGKWHGFEWWLNHEDQRSLWQERHFWNDQLHGIDRRWNSHDRLRRGYPRYWIHDERVTKRQYLRKCAKDPTLPPFREEDNRPRR